MNEKIKVDDRAVKVTRVVQAVDKLRLGLILRLGNKFQSKCVKEPQLIVQSTGFLGGLMEWTAPQFEEIVLNCEINSYASAQL
jgi:coenzyme PQQ precursor peptide PqqA